MPHKDHSDLIGRAWRHPVFGAVFGRRARLKAPGWGGVSMVAVGLALLVPVVPGKTGWI